MEKRDEYAQMEGVLKQIEVLREAGIKLDLSHYKREKTARMGKALVKICDRAPDPRKKKMCTYPLGYLLAMIIIAVLGGADSFYSMVDFWNTHEFLKVHIFGSTLGVPSHDAFQYILKKMDHDAMNSLIVSIMVESDNAMRKKLGLPKIRCTHLCIDGKELRRTGRKNTCNGQIRNVQILNFYDVDRGICTLSKLIDSKTNEIPEAQEILKKMNLGDVIVTMDALHAQKETVSIITQKGGGYLIGLKGNQGNLASTVEAMFSEDVLKTIKEDGKYYLQTSEISHNQLEEREFYMIKLSKKQREETFSEWAGLKAFVFYVKYTTDNITGKKTKEIHYYITSETSVEEAYHLVRGHWLIENGLHNGLDTTLKEDEVTVTDRGTVLNLSIILKLCLFVYKRLQAIEGGSGTISKKRLREKIGWDVENTLGRALAMITPAALYRDLERIA